MEDTTDVIARTIFLFFLPCLLYLLSLKQHEILHINFLCFFLSLLVLPCNLELTHVTLCLDMCDAQQPLILYTFSSMSF